MMWVRFLQAAPINMDTTEYLNRKFASGKPRKCWMCQCILTRGTASVDHLKPQSYGGKDSIDNYRLACKPCNSNRGNAKLDKETILSLKGKPKPKKKDYSALAAAIRNAHNRQQSVVTQDPQTGKDNEHDSKVPGH